MSWVLAIALGIALGMAVNICLYRGYVERIVDWVYHAVTGRRTDHDIRHHFIKYYGGRKT